MFKRVIPLEMQIGLLAGSHVAMSLLKSLIICLKEFEEEENVAVFRWSDEKEHYHHTPTSSTRSYQVLSTSHPTSYPSTRYEDPDLPSTSSGGGTYAYSRSSSSGSGRRHDDDGGASSSGVDVNNNDVVGHDDYVHLEI